MQNKIESIDKKISELKRKKADIELKHLQSLAKLIKKSGLADLDVNILAGALLSIKNANSKQMEEWRKAGEKFCSPKRVKRAK